jgi:hypothetical protein
MLQNAAAVPATGRMPPSGRRLYSLSSPFFNTSLHTSVARRSMRLSRETALGCRVLYAERVLDGWARMYTSHPYEAFVKASFSCGAGLCGGLLLPSSCEIGDGAGGASLHVGGYALYGQLVGGEPGEAVLGLHLRRRSLKKSEIREVDVLVEWIDVLDEDEGGLWHDGTFHLACQLGGFGLTVEMEIEPGFFCDLSNCGLVGQLVSLDVAAGRQPEMLFGMKVEEDLSIVDHERGGCEVPSDLGHGFIIGFEAALDGFEMGSRSHKLGSFFHLTVDMVRRMWVHIWPIRAKTREVESLRIGFVSQK